jgi:hypothetical protein
MALLDGTLFAGTIDVTKTPAPLALQQPDEVPPFDPGALVDTLPSPSAWDTMIVGDDRLPGVAIVSGGRRSKVDQKSSPGSDGSTLTFLGREPADINVKLVMWDGAQLRAWAKILTRIMPPPGKIPPAPYDVYHPALAVNRIRSLYLMDVGLLKPSGQPGVWECELRFLEFLPPNKVGINTPFASKSTAKQGAGKKQALPKPSETEHKP